MATSTTVEDRCCKTRAYEDERRERLENLRHSLVGSKSSSLSCLYHLFCSCNPHLDDGCRSYILLSFTHYFHFSLYIETDRASKQAAIWTEGRAFNPFFSFSFLSSSLNSHFSSFSVFSFLLFDSQPVSKKRSRSMFSCMQAKQSKSGMDSRSRERGERGKRKEGIQKGLGTRGQKKEGTTSMTCVVSGTFFLIHSFLHSFIRGRGRAQIRRSIFCFVPFSIRTERQGEKIA
jgi:hypothetical protein